MVASNSSGSVRCFGGNFAATASLHCGCYMCLSWCGIEMLTFVLAFRKGALYTLNAQCPESRWEREAAKLRVAVDTFQVIG